MWIFSKIKELEHKIKMMRLHEPYHLHAEDLHKLQDLVCKHYNWKSLGTREGWSELECQDCGKLIALSCEHMGSMACQDCIDKFIKEAQCKTKK